MSMKKDENARQWRPVETQILRIHELMNVNGRGDDCKFMISAIAYGKYDLNIDGITRKTRKRSNSAHSMSKNRNSDRMLYVENYLQNEFSVPASTLFNGLAQDRSNRLDNNQKRSLQREASESGDFQ